MNEKAEQLVIDAGTKVLEYLEATEGFTAEQAPLLAQEIVLWGIWGNGVAATICLIIAMLLGYVCPGIFKRAWVTDSPEIGVPAMFGCAASVGFGIAFLIYFFYVFKAVIAPRLYILEQIGKLL